MLSGAAIVGMALAALGQPPRTEHAPPAAWGSHSAIAPEAVRGGSIGRLREGTRLAGEPGYFRLSGDRATFFSADGKLKMACLENLGLERVVRLINDNPNPLNWLVSGTVTEYRGNNYLLLTHAVLDSQEGSSSR